MCFVDLAIGLLQLNTVVTLRRKFCWRRLPVKVFRNAQGSLITDDQVINFSCNFYAMQDFLLSVITHGLVDISNFGLAKFVGLMRLLARRDMMMMMMKFVWFTGILKKKQNADHRAFSVLKTLAAGSLRHAELSSV